MFHVEPSPDYWFKIIVDLERILPLRELAKKVDSSAASLCRYKAGTHEPRYSVGRKLIALHHLRTCKGVICSAPETQPIASSGCG